jgi:plastocyanin
LGVLSLTFAAAAARAETIRVTVDNLAFTPAQVSARVGDTIEWVSTDFIAHTATARSNEWDVIIPAEGVGRVTLKRAGEIAYYCRYHPNMTGSISVAAE